MFRLQLLGSGQSGANGRSATPLRPIARSSGLATVPMLPRLLLAKATQLRRLHAHQVTHLKMNTIKKTPEERLEKNLVEHQPASIMPNVIRCQLLKATKCQIT